MNSHPATKIQRNVEEGRGGDEYEGRPRRVGIVPDVWVLISFVLPTRYLPPPVERIFQVFPPCERASEMRARARGRMCGCAHPFGCIIALSIPAQSWKRSLNYPGKRAARFRNCQRKINLTFPSLPLSLSLSVLRGSLMPLFKLRNCSRARR